MDFARGLIGSAGPAATSSAPTRTTGLARASRPSCRHTWARAAASSRATTTPTALEPMETHEPALRASECPPRTPSAPRPGTRPKGARGGSTQAGSRAERRLLRALPSTAAVGPPQVSEASIDLRSPRVSAPRSAISSKASVPRSSCVDCAELPPTSLSRPPTRARRRLRGMQCSGRGSFGSLRWRQRQRLATCRRYSGRAITEGAESGMPAESLARLTTLSSPPDSAPGPEFTISSLSSDPGLAGSTLSVCGSAAGRTCLRTSRLAC
mmetsp:Transcript_40055/g.89891  ORF Transcript_40055/g.89891 Transcript_40055/m.89891 type:complete len:268 (-) Transcript_40055:2563-3366(-)